MWQSARVGVVIPAWCEEKLIGRTLGRVPPWVDRLVVVDDASPDETAQRASATQDPRLTVLRHAENRGVGAAIATGYAVAREEGWDVAVVMAADDQMDPVDLPALIEAVVVGGADYAKGNRFVHEDVAAMPRARRFAGRWLARWTNWWSGLSIDDSQCGYTAISRDALKIIDLKEIWPRYGYPNDLLGALALRGLRIGEVVVRPVYRGEESGLRVWHLATIGFLIGRVAYRRLSRAEGRG